VLALNLASLPAVPPDLAFNTAVSFATNTNWQSYGGETTMSHLTQMAALTVQNFLSAATGIAVLATLARCRRICGTSDRASACPGRTRPSTRIRVRLRPARHRASHDQAEASMDQRPARAPPLRLRDGPQLGSPPENDQGPHTLRVFRQAVNGRATPL
jgi:hypothetical protein